MRDALRQAGIDNRSFRFGQVFVVENENLSNPEYALGKKKPPEKDRTIVVLSTNNNPAYPIVVIAPITRDLRENGQWDFPLNAGEAGLDCNCVVQLDLIQPVPKVWLRPNAPFGELPPERVEEVFARLFSMLAPESILRS